jgi:hypothetical protein
MKRFFPAVLGLLVALSGCAQSLPFSSGQISGQPEIHAAQEAVSSFQTPLLEPQGEVYLWARAQLEPEAQDAYDLLSDAIACHQETAVELSASPAQVELALSALRIDHPEYFWFDGSVAYVTTTLPDGTAETLCTMDYTLSTAEAQALLPQVEQYVADCLSSLERSGAQSDYDKVLGVYEYLIGQTDYVTSVSDQSFVSLMTQQQATCAGYARGFQYLMQRLGIPCTLATGYGANGESHGWNIVQVGGQWYQIDVTWGDPVDDTGAPGDSLEYTYCLVTDQEIYRDHTLSSSIPMPECTATEYNYFRKSGLQLTSWDVTRYENLLRSAAELGDDWFTVRFESQADYEAALSALIDQAGLMTLLGNCDIPIPETGVTYSHNDLFYEFSVQIIP